MHLLWGIFAELGSPAPDPKDSKKGRDDKLPETDLLPSYLVALINLKNNFIVLLPFTAHITYLLIILKF